MRDLSWKIISSNYVYEKKWLHVKTDTCQLPDGRIIEPYFVIEAPDFCNTIVVTQEEKIILVRQYRHPIQSVTYELPGGVIEVGEDPAVAALREMEEETGYVSTEIEYLFKAATNPALNTSTAYFYLVKNAQQITKRRLDDLEDIDVVSFSKEEFIQLLADNKLQHGVQLGAIYEAMIRLNWLRY